MSSFLKFRKNIKRQLIATFESFSIQKIWLPYSSGYLLKVIMQMEIFHPSHAHFIASWFFRLCIFEYLCTYIENIHLLYKGKYHKHLVVSIPRL